jgi:hypothetical protein
MTPTSRAASTTQDRPRRGGPGFAVAAVIAWLAMVPVGFFYAASGLVVPGPYLFVMWVVYAVLLVAAFVLTRRRSLLVLAPPVLGAVLWWSVVSAGEAWLGWTG